MDYNEVAKHNTADSCWVILYGNVYDVTDFLPQHPGGQKVVLQLAGQEATEQYDPVHPPGTLDESLPKEKNLGKINPDTLPEKPTASTSNESSTPSSTTPPDLSTLLNLTEIESAATNLLTDKAWAYYYSAADDLYSKSLNSTVYQSILLRPRIFIDCTRCSTSSTFLNHPTQLPLFASPAAMARLAHPSGEKGIAEACATYGAVQMISNNASMTPEQIVAGAPAEQVFGWQLYVQNERRRSEDMLARIAKLRNVKFVVLTLDAPVPGKREHDERASNVGAGLPVRSAVQMEPLRSSSKPEPAAFGQREGEKEKEKEKKEEKSRGGMGTALFAGTAADLTWETTLPWLAKHTNLPIVLKGVQTHEDAYLASLHAPQIKGIILSNHGGRAADTAPPALHTLLEIRKYCPEVFGRVEVYVDGGIKRGTDVVKALCLGAKAVGIGRAPLWGLGVGGREGVERVFEILKAEMETAMRLLGVERVEELGLKHVNARALERDIYDGPSGFEKLGLWVQAKSERVGLARAKL